MKNKFFLLTLGSILEYYDFAIYIYFARDIGKALIPLHYTTANIIATFAILAISAVVRPLGGVVFSHFGDTRGRKYSFIYTVLLMAIPTLLIGLIPNHNQIGILATLLLIILRSIQGFAIGGEVPGSIVFAYEISPLPNKALNTNIVVAGTNLGFLLASIVSSILLNHLSIGFESWRIAFVIGGLLGGISYILRKNLNETPEFTQRQKFLYNQQRLPLANLFKDYKVPLVQMIAFGGLLASALTVYSFFMPTFLATYYHFPLNKLLEYNSYSIFLFLLSALIAGKFDRWLGKNFFIITIFIFSVVGFYLFNNYSKLSIEQIALYHGIVLFYIGLICGRLPVLIASFFPVQVRFSGVALSYNICFGIIGGLTQLILFSLLKISGLAWIPAAYLTIFAIFAIIFFSTIPAKKLVNYN